MCVSAALVSQAFYVLPPQNPPDWQEILTYFRGSELQNYFTKILEDDLRAIVKPQYVDQIPKTVKVRIIKEDSSPLSLVGQEGVVGIPVCLFSRLQGSVGAILSRKDDTETQDIVCEQLGKNVFRYCSVTFTLVSNEEPE